jgi:ferredoxin
VGYTVKIDKHSCQSSGNCVNELPAAFGFDDDDVGDVLPAASAQPRDRLLQAAKRCPALAITLYDENGEEL